MPTPAPTATTLGDVSAEEWFAEDVLQFWSRFKSGGGVVTVSEVDVGPDVTDEAEGQVKIEAVVLA